MSSDEHGTIPNWLAEDGLLDPEAVKAGFILPGESGYGLDILEHADITPPSWKKPTGTR
jgi:hypothetical protein